MKQESRFNKRIELVKKIDKDYKPTSEELKEAYGYLDTCLDCGRSIKWGEPTSHSIVGNSHRFGCSILGRMVGWIFNFLLFFLIKLPLFIIIMPFYLLFSSIRRLVTGSSQK